MYTNVKNTIFKKKGQCIIHRVLKLPRSLQKKIICKFLKAYHTSEHVFPILYDFKVCAVCKHNI